MRQQQNLAIWSNLLHGRSSQMTTMNLEDNDFGYAVYTLSDVKPYAFPLQVDITLLM